MVSLHPATTFEQWASEVDALCSRHLLCDWANLCGELEPLRQAHEGGDTPWQFVERWALKYDLEWAEPSGA